MHRARLLACSALALACGPSPGTTTQDASTGALTSSSDSSSAETTPPTTTHADTTQDSGSSTSAADLTTTAPAETTSTESSTTADASSSDDGGSTTGDPICEEPADPAVEAWWSLTVEAEPPAETLSAPCVVVTSEVVGPDWLLRLDCVVVGQSQGVELVIHRVPERAPSLFVGAERVLEYRRVGSLWTSEWFAIHPEGNSFITDVSGIQADSVAPPDTTPVDFFGVDIAVIDGLCEPIDTGTCGPSVRMALEMQWSSGVDQIFDGQTGSLTDFGGTITAYVSAARRPHESADCVDVPPAWFSVVTSGSFGP